MAVRTASVRRGVGIALVGLVMMPALLACGDEPEEVVKPDYFGECPATALPRPAEIATTAGQLSIADMDSSGRFVVGTFVPATSPAADAPQTPVFRWDGDVPTLLPVPNGRATGVNASGGVVGTGKQVVDGQDVTIAWAYSDALNYVVLPTPDGYAGASASAINDKGVVVGVAYKDGTSAAVVVWNPGGGGYQPAVFEASPDVQANDITEDGTIVGQEDHRPYAWAPDGTRRALPIPAGLGTGAAVRARGAWAVGYINADVSVVIRWNLRNDDLVVAGPYPQGAEFMTVSTIGNVAYTSAFGSLVDQYGDQYALPALPEAQPTEGGPVAISDNGMVVAGNYPHGPVVWRCAPTPDATPTT